MKPPAFDGLDQKLLNGIQWDFPLAERPFEVLGDQLGTTGTDVIHRLEVLKRARIVRQISAIFDTRAMGYRSSLVAMRVAPARLEEAARLINGHPGVSHNYRRGHAFNLWFTVAVEPNGDLQAHVDTLHRLAGAEQTIVLPTLKLFKIGVRLDMTGASATKRDDPDDIYSEEDRQKGMDYQLTPLDIAIVRELQEDLPLVPEPYAVGAAQVGITVGELFECCRLLRDNGKLRRVAAILHHRRAGYKANGMGVWAVPPDGVDEVGAHMASFRNVSHCYLRPTYRSWPYNLFSMIHGRSRAEVETVASEISRETGVVEYEVLYSSVEYKKVRLKLFTPDFAEWERRNVAPPAVAQGVPAR